MRQLLLVTLLSVFMAGPMTTHAQSEQGMSEIRFQISDGTATALIDALVFGMGDVFHEAFSGYTYTRTNNHSIRGTYGVGYKYYVSPRFNVGADALYAPGGAKYEVKKDDDVRQGERKTTMLMLLPTAEYIYMNKQKMQLYGNLGAGVLYFDSESTVNGSNPKEYKGASFAFQVNPIGLRYGEKYAGFMELGIGFKGYATIGFSIRL